MINGAIPNDDKQIWILKLKKSSNWLWIRYRLYPYLY